MPSPPSSNTQVTTESLRMHSFETRFEALRIRAQRAGADPAAMTLPAEGMVAGSGLDLHYLEWPGPTAEPLILLLHGGGLNAHTFDVAGALLRPVGRCIALDLRGHGSSNWAPDADSYGTDAIADDIDAVITSFGSPPTIVVGQSLGGMSALVWAARARESLAGVVVVDAGPTLEAGSQDVGRTVVSRDRFIDLHHAHAFVTGSSDTSSATHSAIASNLRWDDDGLLTWKYDPSQFASNGSRIAIDDDLRIAARQIECPTLVLRGDRSTVFSDDGAEELAGLLQHGRWERVPNSGHNVQLSNPVALAHQVRTFITEVGLS